MSEMAPLEAPLGIRAVKARFCEFVEWLNERVTMSEILCFSTRAGFCGFANLAALLSSINRLYHAESKQLAHMLSLIVVRQSTVAFAVLLQATTTFLLSGTEPLE